MAEQEIVVTTPLVTPYKGEYRQHLDDDEETQPEGQENTSSTEPSDEATSETEPSDPEERVWRKRYGDLKSHHDKTVNPLRTRVDTLEKQLNTAAHEDIVLPKTQEELAAWREEYPDVFDIIVTAAGNLQKDATSKIESRMDEIEKREQRLLQESGKLELLKLHPDLDEIKGDKAEDLYNWAMEQPMEIQDWLYKSTDPQLASKALDLYKLDRGITKPKKRSKKKDAELAAEAVTTTKSVDEPSGQNKRTWTESEIIFESRKDPTWFEKHEDELDVANIEGRITMDVSHK